jgi:ABC-type multidrug transport system ATPase subunit
MMQLQGVAKEFDFRVVLDDVTLRLESGTWYSLVAPNGSGKTTLLQVMAGISKPTRGQVLWGGNAFLPKHRRELGVVLQQPLLYGDLTAAENLVYYASLYQVPNAKRAAAEWLEKLKLWAVRDQRVKELSKGMKQRLAIARALIHNPSLILLDEPFDGLDAESSRNTLELLKQAVGNGATIFMVTHNPTEVRHADICYTLRFGRLVKLT